MRLFEVLVFLLASGLVAFTLSFAGSGLGDRPAFGLLDAAFWVVATALVEFLPVPIWKSLQVGTGFPLFTAVAFLYTPGLAGVIAFLGSSDPRELR
jgi:hypothetical protein